MLHLITFAVDLPFGPKRDDVVAFFSLLPFVLPCKYCRTNLTDHMEKEPIDPKRLARWFWKIHNMANAKLRSQKIPTAADPSFEAVEKAYMDRLGVGCTRTLFEGWEFLFSAAEAHPMSLNAKNSDPMPGAPKGAEAGLSLLEKNRWNLLTPEERLAPFEAFFNLLPKVLPYPEWRAAAAEGCGGPPDWSTRASTLKSLWGIRCSMESRLELLNKTSYSSLCKVLKENRSGCGAVRRGKTCRRKK
jgi:hypothetical protein